MTNAAISVAKYTNDRHKTWHDSVTTLKHALIRSLGPTLSGTIAPPPDGFKMKSIQDIVTAVRTKFGVVDQVALNKMEEILTSPLDQVSNLDKHLAKLHQHILMQAAAGYAIEEYRQVRIFRKSVGGHHQIAQCMSDFDRLHPDPLLHTYSAITAYVTTHLPNIRAAADLSSSTSGRALAVQPATASTPANTAKMQDMSLLELQCAYSVLEHKHGNLQKRQRRGDKGKKDDKRHKSAAKGVECAHYCHAHGYNNSHQSAQCKVMAGQKANFTEKMRKASSPTNPPGGSTLVRGKEQ